jgi:hypothetical protein
LGFAVLSFFYFTTLGAIYFYTLIAVCGFAIWRGGRDASLYSYCVLGVFLADRTLLATMTDESAMIFLGGVAEFIAFIFVIFLGTAIVATRVVAFLFAMKMIMYVCLLSGLISFGTMAAWTELAGYLQLLIILGSASNGYRDRLAKYHPSKRGAVGSVFSFKNRRQDQGRS